MLAGHRPRETIGEILHFVRFLADDETVAIDREVALSETATGFRNLALANYMRAHGKSPTPGRDGVRRLFPPVCHRDELLPAGAGRTLSCRRRAQSQGGIARGLAGAGQAHQCHDANVRSLRWIR